MTVSFIVTSYNYAEYIKETIESIINQSYKDIEIIVVDDFSKDDSVKILAQYSQIKLIKHSSNLGQMNAILSGLKQATGEYVSIIDSDDVLYDIYTETMLNYFNTNDVSFVNCNCDKQSIISTRTNPFGGWWWSPMSCSMFKKEYLECLLNYKPENNWRICPDKFIFNIAYLQKPSLKIKEKLVNKREHNKNAGKTKNRFLINLKNNLIIRSQALKIIKQKELRNIIKKSYPHLITQILKKITNL